MRKKKQKKILISVIAAVLVVAMGVGIWFGVTHSQKDPVYVLEFMNIGMTEYWGDNMETHGPVSTDNIQTVYLSDTQTVTEILVKEGDTVKKGDPLMTFDTTLSGLDLERKRLEVEKLKLEVIDAEDELRRINALRPMQTPPPMPDSGTSEPNLGSQLSVPYRISGKPGFDGSSPTAPLICWLGEGTSIDARLIDEILEVSMGLRMDSLLTKSSPSAEDPEQPPQDQPPEEQPPADAQQPDPEPVESQSGETEPAESQTPETKPQVEQPPVEPVPLQIVQPASRDNPRIGTVITKKLILRDRPAADAAEVVSLVCWQANVRIFDQVTADGEDWLFVQLGKDEGWVPMKGNIHIEEPPQIPPAPPEDPEDVTPMAVLDFYCTPADAVVTLRRNNGAGSFEKIGRNKFRVEPGTYFYTVQYDGYKPLLDKKITVPEDTGSVVIPIELEAYQDLTRLNSCYVVFKVTENNMSLGNRTLWQGMKLYQNGYFSFFDATQIPDYTLAADLGGGDEEDLPDFDIGSGMTGAQIAQMRNDQEKKIEELRLKVRMAEAEYKIKKRELEDGNIYADFDGKVVSLLSEEDARKGKKPIMKVSGGGGFHVIGSIGEFAREKLQIGQEVTVNDWNSGESYSGKIISIGDFPIRGRGYNGMGNPNSSYYPFTVFVDGEANLQAGSYVNIQYSAGGESGIYLENPFLRTEKGESYVYVLGKNNRLEKRTVTTGKSLWGSYTEITSGLTADDWIAFPYGKNVKPGAKAVKGEMRDLYGR